MLDAPIPACRRWSRIAPKRLREWRQNGFDRVKPGARRHDRQGVLTSARSASVRKMKFVANTLVGIHILRDAEAIALGVKGGLAPTSS